MEEEITLTLGGKPDESGDGGFEAELLREYENAACTHPEFSGAPILKKCARLALKAHILPSIENEAHKALKEVADEAAIRVFAENVRKLLLAGVRSSPKGALLRRFGVQAYLSSGEVPARRAMPICRSCPTRRLPRPTIG